MQKIVLLFMTLVGCSSLNACLSDTKLASYATATISLKKHIFPLAPSIKEITFEGHRPTSIKKHKESTIIIETGATDSVIFFPVKDFFGKKKSIQTYRLRSPQVPI